MPQSFHSVFRDPYPYQTAIRAADVETVVTSKGKFSAELTRIDLIKLWMQRSNESLAQTSRAANSAERAPIFFLSSSDQAEMRHSGMQVAPGDLVVYAKSATHYRCTAGACRWASMSLTPADLAAAGRALAGRDIEQPALTYRLRPSAALTNRLMALHDAVGHLAIEAPETLQNVEVARSLENELIATMVACLTENTPIRMAPSGRQHMSIAARFEELLAANRSRPLYLAEICAAVGASERTLRNICQEHLGVGPIRYLWLRRMHLARRALMQANAETSSVTEVAMDHGFWELGRFAVAYKTLFGESPSASLQRQPDSEWKTPSNPFAFVDSESA